MNKKNQENILTITFISDNGYSSYISYLMYLTQNQDKMKPKSNIALEGTCSGDVVGGLLSWTGENLQALLFFPERGGYIMENQITEKALKSVTDSITMIKHVMDRMDFLVKTSIMSSDNDGWYEAHADASRVILEEDIERLLEVANDLETVIPDEDPGGAS